jgi:DNA modification methylase
VRRVYDHELARKAARAFPQIVTDLRKTVQELSRAKILDNRSGKLRPIRTIRDLSQYYAQKRARREASATVKSGTLLMAKRNTFVDQCVQGRWEDSLPQLLKAGMRFHLIFADPPYVYPHGMTYSGKSVARMDSDGTAPQEAIATTISLLRNAPALLVSGGCLLLCQPAGPLLLEFHQTLRDEGLSVHTELIWAKSSPKPGSFDRPYTCSTERIWVIARAADRLRNHDLSSRDEILLERPVEHDAGDPHASHMFQKPPGLCQRLLRKHTYEGAVVFEPFGCSGAMSLAANLSAQLARPSPCTRHRNSLRRRTSTSCEYPDPQSPRGGGYGRPPEKLSR